MIPFNYDKNALVNPGRLFELYLKLLHPGSNRLFQRGRDNAKNFDLHSMSQFLMYEKKPVGKMQIPSMLPDLCEAVEKPRLTNHSCRTTAITTLVDLGYDDRKIIAASGKFEFKKLRFQKFEISKFET